MIAIGNPSTGKQKELRRNKSLAGILTLRRNFRVPLSREMLGLGAVYLLERPPVYYTRELNLMASF
jgi:hypothetical protein